jgi:hypothetical protein
MPLYCFTRASVYLLLSVIPSVIALAEDSLIEFNVGGYERVLYGNESPASIFDGPSPFSSGNRFTDRFKLVGGLHTFSWQPGDVVTLRINAPAGQAFSYQPSPVPPNGELAFEPSIITPTGAGGYSARLLSKGPDYTTEIEDTFLNDTQEFFNGVTSLGPALQEFTSLFGAFYRQDFERGGLYFYLETFAVENSLLFTSIEFKTVSAISLSGELDFRSPPGLESSFLGSLIEVNFAGHPEDYPEGAPFFILVPIPEPSTAAGLAGLVSALLVALRRRSRA